MNSTCSQLLLKIPFTCILFVCFSTGQVPFKVTWNVLLGFALHANRSMISRILSTHCTCVVLRDAKSLRPASHKQHVTHCNSVKGWFNKMCILIYTLDGSTLHGALFFKRQHVSYCVRQTAHFVLSQVSNENYSSF